MEEFNPIDSEKLFVGVTRADFDPFWIPQKENGWSWAACQEAVFKFYGINEPQSRIAMKLCGLEISNRNGVRTSKPAMLKDNINHFVDLDLDNNFYTVNVLLGGESVNVRYLLKELQLFRPVTVFSRSLQRALIITGAQVHFKDGQAVIKKFYLRDPAAEYNSVKGRRVITSPKKFLQHVQHHWYVNTRLLDIPSHYNQIVAF